MSPAEPPVISVRGLTKRYPDFSLGAQDVNVEIAAGTCAALVGPADAGKSTILGILLGLLPPTAGTVTLRHGRGPAAVGGVLDPRGLHPRRTVRDHLRVYAAAARVPDTRVTQVLETTGLTERARTRADRLTPGETTRAALATALLAGPRVLLLDDPFTALDPAEQSWLHGFLHGHVRRGGVALFSTRSLAAALPIADHLVVLSGGSVVYQGSPARLRRRNPDRLVVASSSPVALATMLAAHGRTDAVIRPDNRLAVADATEADIVSAARDARVRILDITPDPIHPDRVLASLTGAVAPQVPAAPTSSFTTVVSR